MIRTALIFLWIIGLASFSCISQKNGPGAPSDRQKEVRLGKSRYFVLLPNDLRIAEARGKEGGLGYAFTSRRKESDVLGFIEIEHSHSINTREVFISVVVKDSLYAPFLGTRTLWTIKETIAGLIATTPDGNVSAYIVAKERKDIDRLIMVFSTLSEK